MRHASRALLISPLFVSLLLAPTALAQTGVSDDRVSLPDGPGSLDGIGDNANVNANMGQSSYSVNVAVPAGFAGLTPQLSMRYSSGGGGGVMGVGWSMSLPYIERMTSKGLPEYTDADRFVADGGTQLVRVSEGDPATYRARFEGGFIRYQWHAWESSGGQEGYWTAEYPDGRVSYYGADSTGTPVISAQVRQLNGIFRYLIVETVDPFGHKITYDYQQYGAVPLIDFIGYVYTEGEAPKQSVTFDYEERNDRISDARGGFNELLAHRLTRVSVFSGAERVRYLDVNYEPYSESGGVSRVASISQYGANGTKDAIEYSFEYTRALGGVCDGVECEGPYLVDMGALGFNLQGGKATLIDMNGDGLADVIHTPDGGAHQIFLAELQSDGTHTYVQQPDSAIGNTGGFDLASPYVQVLDYDGDGFADLINATTGEVLRNTGAGDWSEVVSLGAAGVADLPDFGEDFQLDDDAQLSAIRFFDYDGDRKIDVLKSTDVGSSIFRNLGNGGFAQDTTIEDIGASFATENLDLADMNGDGLLDPVIIAAGEVRYRINLGRGQWADWFTITNAPVTPADLPFASLEDLNGDGIDDLVVVVADEVRYALNRNGTEFDSVQTVQNVSGGSIPTRDGQTTVLFADMNANGSNDVVWIDASGEVIYLELFPVRPNLLSRIENGLGMVTEFTYGTSAEHKARDGGVGWDNPLASPMLVVNTADTYAQHPSAQFEVHDLTTYEYTGGYYDGDEKQFRGFANVRQITAGGENQEGSVVDLRFDLGEGGRPAFAGRLLEEDIRSESAALQSIRNTYELCDVAGVPTSGLDFEIQWVCQTRQEVIHQEGRPESEWVKTATDFSFDGYGNITEKVEHGVISVGGGGCPVCDDDTGVGSYSGACGEQCLGDESFEQTDYADPEANGNWLLRLPVEERSFAEAGGRVAVTRTFYDGEPFIGLPLGETVAGVVTRIVEVLEDGAERNIMRVRRDVHGNVVEEISPNGSIDSESYHTYTFMSADGLDVIGEESTVTTDDGTYRLKRDYDYEPRFGKISRATEWYLDGEDPSLAATRWTYDEFGRMQKLIRPGDSEESPTVEFAYELGAPFSRTITKRRTTSGGPQDLEEITCTDGLGRELQTRTRIDAGRYWVSGYRVMNRRGEPIRIYEPFEASTGECEVVEPPSAHRTYFYDALGREVRVVHPDSDVSGGASERRVEFRPLQQWLYSEDDNDSNAPGFNTPNILVSDGLNRTILARRLKDASGSSIDYRIYYDGLGEIRGYKDPEGNLKTQTHDLAGRVISVVDPDAGERTFTYDAAGNLLTETDATGTTITRRYDDLGRKIEEYDAANKEATLAEFFYAKHPDCPELTCTFLAGRVAGSRVSGGEFGETVTALGYDARGRVVRNHRRVGAAGFLFESTYDNADRTTQETYPDGTQLSYELDGAGRLTSVPGVISSITRDERGLIQSFTLANGAETVFQYDSQARTSAIETQSGGQAIVDLQLQYDRVGNLLEVQDGAAPNGEQGHSARYTYDSLNRMLVAALDEGLTFEETITAAFDDLDRVTSKTSSLQDSQVNVGDYAYQADGPRQVSTAGARAFAYDAAGRVTARGDDAYRYNFLGRLSGVDRSGEALARYAFDAAGDRVVERVEGGQTYRFGKSFEVRDGVGRVRVFIDTVAVAELENGSLATTLLDDSDADGAITAADALAVQETDALSTTLRAAARRLLLNDQGLDRAYLHTNQQGSVIAVTDEDGALRERMTYYPFGGLRSSSAKQTEYASYTGQEHDVTGLLDYGVRQLATREGRWLTPDPLFTVITPAALGSLVDAFISYGFASNNPSTLLDVGGTLSESNRTRIKIGLGVTATAAALGVGIATGAIAGALAAATVVNIVGAVVGGVVAAGASYAAERQRIRTEYKAERVPLKVKAGAAVSVVIATVLGTVSGFFSGGISAAGSVVEGAADVMNAKGKLSTKRAFAAKMLGGIAQAAIAVVNPLKLATTAASIGLRVASGVAGVVGKAVLAVLDHKRNKRVKRLARRQAQAKRLAGGARKVRKLLKKIRFGRRRKTAKPKAG